MVFVLVSFVVSLSVVQRAAGFWGVVVAFCLAPVTFLAAPWYALVAWDNPLPLILTYGTTSLSWLVEWIGERIEPRDA